MKLLFASVFVILYVYSFAQNEIYEFQYKKNITDASVVAFEVIEKNQKEVSKESLENKLLECTGVISSTLINSGSKQYYKLKIKEFVTAENIRKILLKYGYDFDQNSVNKTVLTTAHYPVFVDTGNPEEDHNRYEKEKQEWIKNYPEEVEVMRGMNTKQEPSGFPTYINTGNPSEDDIRYEKAKQEWLNKQGEKNN